LLAQGGGVNSAAKWQIDEFRALSSSDELATFNTNFLAAAVH